MLQFKPIMLEFRPNSLNIRLRFRSCSCKNCMALVKSMSLTLQDNSVVGIRATIAKLNAMLQHYDAELWAHLEQKNKVKNSFAQEHCMCCCTLTQAFAVRPICGTNICMWLHYAIPSLVKVLKLACQCSFGSLLPDQRLSNPLPCRSILSFMLSDG